MAKTRSRLTDHRARMADQGFVRVEVNVHKDDAALVREVVHALSDPARKAVMRARLEQSVAPAVDLKALLASAPLDGIDLTRSPDTGRDIEF